MKLVREVKGAVYVELLIAYLPVLFFFLATWQLIEMAAANLIVKRAASAAARAAVVVLPDNPRYYGGAGVNSPTGLKKVDIDQAARLVLLASPHLGSDFRVELSGGNVRSRSAHRDRHRQVPLHGGVGELGVRRA